MNMILIGMPGAGKSTIGIILAKTLGYSFVDTDLAIQKVSKKLLQDIIDKDGINTFLKKEEEVLLSMDTQNTVIATGGSAVYSQEGMKHLKSLGKVIYLKVELSEIEKRLKNIKTRGIAMSKAQSIKELYIERCSLYEQFADIIVDCINMDVEGVINRIVEELKY